MRIPCADGTVRLLVLFGLLLPGPLAAQDSNQTDPEAAQRANAEVQRLLAAGEYAGAVQRAQEIVQIEQSRNAGSGALSDAYHQLGRSQLFASDASGATASLLRALQLLESSESVTSPRFIGPLVDLAAAEAALGDHDAAISALQQAIVLQRRADGLFNIGQLELLDRMANSFEAIGDVAGVDKVRRYAVLAAERQFGPDSPECLPAIGKLANWFEMTGRYSMARSLYERTARIASLEGGERNATVINALLGVGRSHRLQYVETPELVENSFWGGKPGRQFDPVTGQRDAIAGAVDRPGMEGTAKLNQRGRDALLKSLKILNSAADPPRDLLAKTLLELGDWYQTDRDTTRAISYYKRAWPLLEESNTEESPNPLLTPRPLFYRLPPNLRQSRAMRHGSDVARQVEFVMTITERGDVSNLIRKDGDMTEGLGWQVARTLQRATFSPRFEKGEPVATAEFVFTETFFEVKREEVADPAESARP